jgi:23S rRNA (cytosine1962-C5)-methyltransferase
MNPHTLLPTIKLAKAKSISHPWVYSSGVIAPKERLPPGSLVQIASSTGEPLGVGFYNGRTRIALRVLSQRADQVIDEDFFLSRLQMAMDLRKDLLTDTTNMVRLVHSEGDLLPGLVIDLFGDQLVIEWFSAGMFRCRELIKNALGRMFPEYKIYWFAEKRLQKQESFDCWELPPPPPAIALESGLKFKVSIGSHRKTGFFVDQRDNRRLLATLSQGAKVADLCCHTGAFSVYAKALGKAAEVTAVDLDPSSLEIAQENAALNNITIKTEEADVYQWLKQKISEKTKYSLIILDPPKQTRSQELVDAALNKYVALNRLAMEIIQPGGTLLTCSCSGLISEDQFVEALKRAAFHCGKTAQIFHISGAGYDHPFVAQAPESRYLKAVWAKIL